MSKYVEECQGTIIQRHAFMNASLMHWFFFLAELVTHQNFPKQLLILEAKQLIVVGAVMSVLYL